MTIEEAMTAVMTTAVSSMGIIIVIIIITSITIIIIITDFLYRSRATSEEFLN